MSREISREQFILLSLEQYFIEANTIEICLDNYGLKYDALVDVKTNKEIYPPFFAHYMYLLNFYEEHKNASDFECLTKKELDKMRDTRFKNFIECLTPVAENLGLKEKLSDIYTNKLKYFKENFLSDTDARACAYFEVIKAIRKKEEDIQDA